MSLSLFGTSGRTNERGQMYCYLPCRLATHVSAQVALQRCPILCMSSWIISLLQVGSFSKLKCAHFQYYFSVILGPSGCIFKVKVGSFLMLKIKPDHIRCVVIKNLPSQHLP
jgi:hypothetical protein